MTRRDVQRLQRTIARLPMEPNTRRETAARFAAEFAADAGGTPGGFVAEVERLAAAESVRIGDGGTARG